jgi:hypothetical protein
LRLGDAAPLPGGGLIVAHADADDRRLIAFDADGAVTWQRSYSEISRGSTTPIVAGGQVFLLSQENDAGSDMTLFGLDMSVPDLIRLFRGGARPNYGASALAWPLDDGRLVLRAAGEILVALDLEAAARAAAGE